MTTYERDARTLELPWPFTGREEELALVRRSLTAGRHGIVVTGPAGCGKTRLAVEAVRGTDCAKVAGTPGTHRIPFAAFAHLLPESVSLHRAVQLLSGVRLLLVDDAHLLDDASAALVHHLATHGRTRLVVVARDGEPMPGAVSRLWTGEVLPRLALEALPDDDMAHLLAAGAGGRFEPLTVNRLRRLCGGDLRLLRDLSGALAGPGLLTPVPGTATVAWRGPVPLTETVRLRAAPVLARVVPAERETLDRLAFAEPLAPDLHTFDLPTLERLESDGLIAIDAAGTVRLARALYGPVLRAAAGTLRTRRLARTPDDCAQALKSEAVALEDRIEEADVRTFPTPVGDWLMEETGTVPADYAAIRARHARLRGALREASAWAREGLRTSPDDALCRTELALGAAQSAEPETVEAAMSGHPHPPRRLTAWLAAARGDTEGASVVLGGGAGAGRSGGTRVVPGGAGECVDARFVPGEAARGGVPEGARAVGGQGVRAVGDLGVRAVAGEGLSSVRDEVAWGPPGTPPRTTPTDPAWTVALPGARATTDGARSVEAQGARAGLGEGVQPPAPTPVGDPPQSAAEHPYAERAAYSEAYDAVRLGVAERAVGVLPPGSPFARHAEALARADGPALDRAAALLEARGFLLFAAEAHAQAVAVHRDPSAARLSRTRAITLARRCQGARTPALSGLALGELTARQRQIVTLAAAGLSNRQIAERLTLSVRTVGNHLYSAYTRLGASDRSELTCLIDLPDAASA
ncbi:LuxR C-terminal-related transcriptional regulator [Streptomyces sp. NPDC056716]|uniref:LuxR C-terminal-related transcriptional regulator n=1 Tax=unclassified Streptomyces TaxID=2593676 RepID=UPI0036B97791